ncbi:MAG: InlB B-repeat-containing protein [Oscillospiraceae bacterium]|nr:InlB B-repeat-containing protein [Oscillospiraceae bacterium]
MKKRILSLLLAFLMAFSSVSTSVFAVDTATEPSVIGRTAKFTTQFPYLWSDPTNSASQVIVNGSLLPEKVKIVGVHVYSSSLTLYEIEAAEGYTWPEEYKAYRYVDSTKLELLEEVIPGPNVSIVDKNGTPIPEEGLFLPEGEKITVSAQLSARAAATYQWQICYNNASLQWADLYGATASDLPISGAMLRNVVDYYGKTYVRCVVTTGDEKVISDPVPVTMTAAPVSYRLPSNRAEATARYEEVSPVDSTVQYAITVLFKYADTEQVWTSYLAAGSDYILDIPCPEIPGYIPKNGQTRVTQNITNIQSNVTIIVEYEPDEVDFVVEHYWQYVDRDEYELHETQTVSGLKTGDYVGSNLHKTYTGFDHLNYDSQITVAADGSTVVKIYYDREYFMVSVNLNGGYGTEPVCARYGAPIVVPDPQRTGYTFAGWLYDQTGVIHDDLPATVPAYNTSYTAQWATANTYFTVAFWYENPNDPDYTFVGSVRKEGLTGNPVNGYNYRNEAFTGRDDDHFTYKTADTNVAIQADGSTVVNVYFSRNTYTLKYWEFVCPHKHGSSCYTSVTTCGKVQHTHSHDECCSVSGWHLWHGYASCPYKEKNGGPNGSSGEHTHSSSCYSSVLSCDHATQKDYLKCACAESQNAHIKNNPDNWVLAKDPNGNDASYTFKYEQEVGYIHQQMQTAAGYRWIPGDCDGFPGRSDFANGGALGTFTSMPGGDTEFYRGPLLNLLFQMTYWLETTDGTGTYKHGKYFVQGATFVTKMSYVGYGGDYVGGLPQGYELFKATYGDSFGADTYELTSGGKNDSCIYNNFYYVRKTFNLTYFNGSEIATTKTMKYNEVLTSSYNLTDLDMVSPYGAGYAFGGWYLDPACTVPVSWGSTRMPDGGLAVYAKWVPVLHKVTTYLTKGGDKLNSYDIYHDTTYSGNVADPIRAGFNFVGWFYEQDGEEKAYDFSMPVYKDMELYAKWTSDTFVTGNIYYKDTQGNTLADPTPIRGSVGDTKTYNAKVGDALNLAPSDVTYFPNVTSHSITFTAQNTAQNNYTFVYTAKEKVKYEVHFIDTETGAEVAPTVTGESRSATLVFDLQEKGINVKKYTVDAMRKTFALSADDSLNKFYFYFTKDEENATVQVEHYIQNTSGTSYTLYFTEPTTKAKIGTVVTANALSITGFTYDPSITGTVNGVTLPDTGIVLKLYYTRNSYPYQFRFVYRDGSGKEVEFANSRISGTAKYGVTINQVAKSFAGYRLTSAGSMSITVAAEDPASSANIRTFYYEENQVTIRYQVGAGGGGTVSSGSESVKAISGQAKGSTATANTYYVFKGWYSNFACDDAHLVSTSATFVPAKDGVYTATTYYAKFEEVKVNIHYGVIMPDNAKGTATLSKTSESVSILTGRATGSSILTIPAGYAFEGWYDANGNKLSSSANWIPTMPGERWVDGTTYYAKFVENEATITLNVNIVGGGTVQLGENGTPLALITQSLKVWSGAFENVIATAAEGFHFVGWYKDGVLVSTNPVLQLTKTEAEMWTSGTYTAQFERNDADLTIYASGADANQTYLFVIAGDNGVTLNVAIHGNKHVTVRDLPAGVYTVTEQNDWSWRQDAVSSQSANLNNGDQTLTFTFGEVENEKWLSGSDYLLFLKEVTKDA